jgi:hypothetical protein
MGELQSKTPRGTHVARVALLSIDFAYMVNAYKEATEQDTSN